MKKVYLEGIIPFCKQPPTLDDSQFSFPDDSELEQANLQIAHWSYFESWDPYRNYLTAKEHCAYLSRNPLILVHSQFQKRSSPVCTPYLLDVS